jgi:hypothetical protein
MRRSDRGARYVMPRAGPTPRRSRRFMGRCHAASLGETNPTGRYAQTSSTAGDSIRCTALVKTPCSGAPSSSESPTSGVPPTSTSWPPSRRRRTRATMTCSTAACPFRGSDESRARTSMQTPARTRYSEFLVMYLCNWIGVPGVGGFGLDGFDMGGTVTPQHNRRQSLIRRTSSSATPQISPPAAVRPTIRSSS